MSTLLLERNNRAELAAALSGDTWVVACLCAAWCDVCRAYRTSFDALAAKHPDTRFVWIDIEDEADVAGDLDVENFPTLLIQHGDTVAFYGVVLPDVRIAERLLLAQIEKKPAELLAEINGNAERKSWQQDCNLRQRLHDAIDN